VAFDEVRLTQRSREEIASSITGFYRLERCIVVYQRSDQALFGITVQGSERATARETWRALDHRNWRCGGEKPPELRKSVRQQQQRCYHQKTRYLMGGYASSRVAAAE